MKAKMNELIKHFEGFKEEWDEHRVTSNAAVRKVDDIHTHIGNVKDHIEHLDQLPVIASALTNIQDRLLKILMLGLLVLGGVVVVILVKDSTANIKMPGGFEINHNEIKDK